MQIQMCKVVASLFLIAFALSACTALEGPGPGAGIPICLNEPQRCPDLVPVIVRNQADLNEASDVCDFCRITDENAIRIAVKNQGGIGFHKEPESFLPSIGNPDASASITRVTFTIVGDMFIVDLPTPALPVGFSVELEPVTRPEFCVTTECQVAINVDADQTIEESVEDNNTVTCNLPVIN